MRAPPHGAKHAPNPHGTSSRGVGARTAAALLAIGVCGCNSLSGNLNNQVGMWNYQQGNYQAAREEFTRAAADDSQNPAFIYNLACAMRREGDLGAAEATWLRATGIDPSHQPSYHALAALWLQQGRGEQATRLIAEWVRSHPDHAGAQIEMAWIERQNGDLREAEQSLYRSLAAQPNNPAATGRLGELYQEMGQSDRAAVMYRRSLQADWFQPEVQARLALLQMGTPGSGAPAGVMGGENGQAAVAAIPFGTAPLDAQAPPASQIAGALAGINDDPAHRAD